MVTTISQAAKPSYYGAEDYYLDGAVRSMWFGRGTEQWDCLTGEVRRLEADRLENGFSPDGRIALVPNAGEKGRFRGQDQTDSPPGEFRLLWGLERDPVVRRALENALFEATKDKLRFEEETMLYARRGRAGKRTEQAAGSIWSLHFHPDNRRNEPDPHIHARDYNLQLRRDGSWGAMNAIAAQRGQKPVLSRSAIYACKMELGQVFAESLRLRLEALGYRTADASARMGHFKILDVPRELVMNFSTRAKEIAADMKARGVEGAREAHNSALRTRPRKHHVPLAKLRERWIREAGGWDPASIRVQAEERTVTYRVPDELRARVEAKVKAQVYRKVSMSESAVEDKSQAMRSNRRSEERTSRKRVEISRQIPRPEANPGRRAGQQIEDLLGRGLRTHAGITRANVYLSAKQVEYVHGTKFTGDEKSRLNEVTRGRDRVQILGSGSERVRVGLVLSAARIAWERQGYRALLAAPTGREASSLGKETGIHSTTAASLIRSLTHNRGLLAGYDSAVRASFKSGFGFRSTGSFIDYALKAAGRRSFDAKTVLLVVRPAALEVNEQAALLKHARRGGARVVFVDGSRNAADIASELVNRPENQKSRVKHRRAPEQEQEMGR